MDLPIVDVGGKRTLEYVAECLTKFNRGADEIIVRSVGGSISKGIKVDQILQNKYDEIKTDHADIHNITIDQYVNSCLDVNLIKTESNQQNKNYNYDNFIKYSDSFHSMRTFSFPVYNLIFDDIIHKNGYLRIGWKKDNKINNVKIEATKWSFKCNPPEAHIAEENLEVNDLAKEESLLKNMENDLEDETEIGQNESWDNIRKRETDSDKDLLEIYYRSGLLESKNWREIAYKLSEYDDLIIGFDTNILLSATFTEHFLDSLYYFDPKIYTHTPNWMLIIIPIAVMHELEQATNGRNEYGLLTQSGRMGFRALGEILEISQCIDLLGISLIIFGETDTTLDVRAEMSGLKELFININKNIIEKNFLVKSSSGDTIIRDQFKRFLKQVDFFGGGASFITSDKTCAALARTEGLNSIYYKKPDPKSINSSITPITIKVKDYENIRIPVQIGKLLYEFCVQFGKVDVSWNNSRNEETKVTLACDRRGDSLDHWLFRNLFLSGKESRKLIDSYTGKFRLDYLANDVWKNVRKELIKTDFD